MNLTRFLYFISTIVEVAKSSAEADNGSVLAQRLFKSKHMVRGSGSNDEKETENKEETSSVNQSAKRMLEAGTKRLLQLIEINLDCDDDDDDDDDDDEMSIAPSMSPSSTQSITRYEEIFVTSDGSSNDYFGRSCSMANELVVVGGVWVDDNEGAAYLFHMDGTEVAKLTPGDDGGEDGIFGGSVSIDEKIVVGTLVHDYVRVFSRNGTYERTIRCYDCWNFGPSVATLGNLIVTSGKQDSIDQNPVEKLFIYSTEGQLLKTLEEGSYFITDVAISEQFIVSTSTGSKTSIYSNTSPDFPKIAEIYQDGYRVAVSNDRLVIGSYWDDGAYLYKTDGTLVTALDSGSVSSVAITDDKVLVGAPYDDDGGENTGSVFIYSADTGEFIEKVKAPDGEANDLFGSCLSVSDSYFVVGAEGVDDSTGAAYLFNIP